MHCGYLFPISPSVSQPPLACALNPPLSFSNLTLILQSTSILSAKYKRDNLGLGCNTSLTREKQLRISATAGTVVNLHGLPTVLILNQYYTTLPIISGIGSSLCSIPALEAISRSVHERVNFQ